MNTEALLALISELYANLGTASARVRELEAEVARLTQPAD